MTTPSESPTPKHSRSWLLPAILGVAVLLHVGFFFSVHEMQLAFSGSSRSLQYDESQSRRDRDAAADIQEKNSQLAHIFKQMITEASGGQVAAPVLQKGEDFTPPTLTDLPVEWHAAAIDFSSAALPEQRMNIQEYVDTPLAVDIALPSDMPVVDDLLMATEALLGDVQVLTADDYNPYNAQGGRADWASLQGNALDNRSGSRDDGSRDMDHTSYPNLTGAQDITAFDEHLRDLASREQAGLARQLNQQMASQSANTSAQRDSDGDRPLAGAEAPGRVASSSDFAVHVEYAPREHGGGFYFRVVLTPKPEIAFKTIRHNVFFLIDRSQSIDKGRYFATKRAVMEALELLREGDTFNVFVFDDKVVPFSQHNVEVSSGSIANARDFISSQPYGGPFASTDLYASLGNVIPEAVGWQELNTAILLSDGVTYKGKDVQRRNISAWTAHNDGKVALYSLAVGKGNNLPLLDLLVSMNKGTLSFCPTKDDVCEAMSSLVRSLRNPIGKDIMGSVIPLQDGVVAELYPRQGRLPNLYRDAPYVLYGWVSHPDDFFIFLQGRYYDRFLDIKQRVSFRGGREVAAADLERQMAILQAYELYEAYLIEGKGALLTEARRLLAPHGIPVAFQ